MIRKALAVAAAGGLVSVCLAQQPPGQPPVKVNILNVCSPSAEEQQEMSSALEHLPRKPSFSPDFEVDRGRSLLDQGSSPLVRPALEKPDGALSADFVRIRRDFEQTPYSTVQYSFSRDQQQMVETLVFRLRDPKDLLQLSIEDSASAVTAPAVMLGAETPASRIKLERFGKASVVLARCTGEKGGPPPDQSAYEQLFRSASAVLSAYRGWLGARTMVPEELTRIDGRGRTARARGSGSHDR